jgi:hypothetical protein
MSVSGISSSSLFDTSSQSVQNKMKEIQQEFQQLGQDLQSGNLSAAQSDYATLQQMAPQSSSSTAQGNNPLAQAFQQLSQDLQSGNVSAAQQDYTKIQQDLQSQSGQTHGHHHHHAVEAETPRSISYSSNSARRCSQATFPPPNSCSARCSRTCNKAELLLHRVRHNQRASPSQLERDLRGRKLTGSLAGTRFSGESGDTVSAVRVLKDTSSQPSVVSFQMKLCRHYRT